MTPLAAEYSAAHAAMLRRAGLAWASPEACAALPICPRVQGLTPIEPTSDWLYEPAGTRRGWCLPVFDDSDPSELIDLVAWYPSSPDQWYRRTGAGLFLGAVTHPPVRVVRTPLDFALSSLGVASDGVSEIEFERTICVLDWRDTAALRLALGDGPFIAADKALGRKLEEVLTVPMRAKISVRA